MSAYAHLPYRLGVGMMLFNRAGLVFIARRIDNTAEAWQMPQGGVDAGEELRPAAMRELLEEIGTDKASIVAESADWYYYDLPDALVPKIWGGKYRGQKQKWFALRFEAEDSAINIATEHPEFSTWKWAPMDTLPDVIVPFKRALYAALVAEFGHLAGSSLRGA
jgi:putative (di)nucleoside polyphosphate hydrolase